MSVEKFSIGPATVEFGDATPVIFDSTKGGIQVKVTSNWKDLTNDQNGDTPVDTLFKGRVMEVTVPVTESSDLEKLQKVTPNSNFVTDGTDPTIKRVDVYANAGSTLRKRAEKLVIKPLDPAATANDYLTVPKAAPKTDLEWVYDTDNERITAVKFIGFVEDDGRLYFLGDETATP